MTDFHEKDIFELIGWWADNENWKDLPLDDWKEFEQAVEREAAKHFKMMGIVELIDWYRDNRASIEAGWILEWSEALMRSYPFSEVIERLDAIEKTLDVLLKAFGHNDAHKTILQEIDSRHGYAPSRF